MSIKNSSAKKIARGGNVIAERKPVLMASIRDCEISDHPQHNESKADAELAEVHAQIPAHEQVIQYPVNKGERKK
jgi:hypothetical protein